jgi:hypothetical protein
MTDKVICAICDKPIEQTDFKYTDEQGKAVHQHCYEDVIFSVAPNTDGPHAG